MNKNRPSTGLGRDFMGSQPIGSLLARLSIPAMVGMIMNALYNLVDTIFVGQGVGPLAIAALSIVFPIQMITGGFAMTFGVGAASIVSRKLGEREEDEAAGAAGTALTATIITSLLLMVIGFIFMPAILLAFGSTHDILQYAEEYMGVILTGFVFISISMCTNNLVRAEGQAKFAMMIMVTGTGLNIVLDPVFIFVFGMGIRGAAIATVISQLASATLALSFFFRKKSSLPLRRSSFLISLPVLKEIVALGIPTFVRQAGGSLLTMSVNNMLRIYGDGMTIAAFGMINRLLMFFLMPVFGIVQGFQPIAGYNYGAKQFARVKQVLYLSIAVATAMGTIAAIVLETIPSVLISMFTSDRELIALTAPALRIVMAAVPFIGIQAIGSTFFQSIGKSAPALFLGLSRQFIFLIPLVLLLPRLFGLTGVWASFPIADTLSTIVTTIWLIYEVRNLGRIHFESLNPVEKYPV